VPKGGKAPLRPGDNIRLEVASNSPDGPPLTLSGKVAACPKYPCCPAGRSCRPGQAAGVLLQRTDQVKEDYALVWRCLPLDTVFADLPGARVYRCRDAFLLRTGDGGLQWLHPDMRIPSPQGAIAVKRFAQVWL
jgi:hypothetical protein